MAGLVGALDRRGAELGTLVPARGVGLLAERAAMMGLPPGGAVSVGGATRFHSDPGRMAGAVAGP